VWRPGLTGLRDRLLFALLTETGMRLGEALTLRHADLVVGRGGVGYVQVVPRQDHPVPAVRVKDSVGRRILVGADLEALYAEYVWALVDAGADAVVGDLDAHFVFVNTMRGQIFAPLRPETVYDKVASLTRTVPGLPAGWSPHWMRHTHASALLLAGVREHVVMRRLGHADVQTTLSRYGWVTEDAEMRALADWKSFTAGWKGLAL
jgi:integrase